MFQKLLTGFPLLIFFLVLGAVTWLLGHILKPFFFAIFWAILLAAIFDPVNEWLRRKVKNPNVSAGLALAAVILTLILPAGLILTLLVEQSLDLYQSMNQNGGSWMQNLTGFLQSVGSHPLLARFQPDHAMITGKSIELLKTFAEFLVKNLSAFTQNTVVFLIEFAVALYCLFYFFRDGEELFKTISRYLPVDDRHIHTFTSEFLVTAKATLKFTFVIGGIQGLAGFLFHGNPESADLGRADGRIVHCARHRQRDHLGAGGHPHARDGECLAGNRHPVFRLGRHQLRGQSAQADSAGEGHPDASAADFSVHPGRHRRFRIFRLCPRPGGRLFFPGLLEIVSGSLFRGESRSAPGRDRMTPRRLL